MRRYIKEFFKQEEGVEIIEWIAVIMVTAALIGIAAVCGSKIQTKMKGISGYL